MPNKFFLLPAFAMFLLLLTLLPSTEVEGMKSLFRSKKKNAYTQLSSSSTQDAQQSSSGNQLAAAAGGGGGGGDDDREKAGKNRTKIINKLGKKCDKLLTEEECSKKSFKINEQKFTCAWDPNVEKEDKSIGQCVPSAESYERIFPLQAN